MMDDQSGTPRGKDSGRDAAGRTAIEKRRALIEAYLRTGNITAAMREVGIRSYKTAYLWWNRYREGGLEALAPRSHAPRTPARVPPETAAEIVRLRDEHPEWGRRQIARDLARRHGTQIVSPAGVEGVLRRADLWPQPSDARLRSAWTAAGIDPDHLLALIRIGIGFDRRDRGAQAVALLSDHVWAQLPTNEGSLAALMKDGRVGPWLVGSLAYLGHGAMIAGNWDLAISALQRALRYFEWENSTAWSAARRATWEEQQSETGRSRDDVWLWCFGLLGVVLRDRDREAARASLLRAEAAMSKTPGPGLLVPDNYALARGNLQRDLARLELRRRDYSDWGVVDRLRQSEASLRETDAPGMLAATWSTRAELYSRWSRRSVDRRVTPWLTKMIQAMEEALRYVERDPSPLLKADLFLDAAALQARHRLGLDPLRLRRAADYCLTYGYGGQAAHLLDLPGIGDVLARETIKGLRHLVARTA